MPFTFTYVQKALQIRSLGVCDPPGKTPVIDFWLYRPILGISPRFFLYHLISSYPFWPNNNV